MPDESATTLISAKDIRILPPSPSEAEPSATPDNHPPIFTSNLEGALWWHAFGFQVIPLRPEGKRPAIFHHPWLDDLSVGEIRDHWGEFPEQGVGAILAVNQIMIDADTEQAHDALVRLEQQFCVQPSLIIKTSKGFHHHFRLRDGAFAKQDSHHTESYPERLDIKTEHCSVMLTPSMNKSVVHLGVDSCDQMAEVGQDFIDAVFQHNGREAPRPEPECQEFTDSLPATTDLQTLAGLLNCITPDCGYQDWLAVLMAVFHETQGSAEGFELANAWSQRGKSYKGRADVKAKWDSFSADVSNPITVGTLIARARQEGADVASIMDEKFEPCETEVVLSQEQEKSTGTNPLTKHSLRGQAAKFLEKAQNVKPLLGDVCMQGEATVWYAQHNTGKTLIALCLLLEAILKRLIAAAKVFYINADDSSLGLAEKLTLLDEVGAHVLVPGQQGFKADDLDTLLRTAAQNGSAHGTFVLIDTLKKFTDLMNKRSSSDFANTLRQFVMAGGTVLGLAHTNKKRSEDGRAVYAGTSDMLNDCDAGYIIDKLDAVGEAGVRLVEFTQVKSRGGGVQSVTYAYAAEGGLSYGERLASVRLVDPDAAEAFKRLEEERTDAEVIAAISACITEGINTKMALRDTVAERMGISRRAVVKVIERYTGDDPSQHRWNFTRVAKGAMVFVLIHQPAGP